MTHRTPPPAVHDDEPAFARHLEGLPVDRLDPKESSSGRPRGGGGRGVPTGWLWVLSLAVLSVCYGWFVIMPLKHKLMASLARGDVLDEQIEVLSTRLRAAEAAPHVRAAHEREPVLGVAQARDEVVEGITERLQPALDRGLVTVRPEEDRVVVTFATPLPGLEGLMKHVAEAVVPHAPMARLHLEVSGWAGPGHKPRRRHLPAAKPWLLQVLSAAETAWTAAHLRWDVTLAEDALAAGDVRLIIALTG